MTTEQVEKREKAKVLALQLQKAVESGVVWNSEFEDLKSRLSSLVWRETSDLLWPAMREVGNTTLGLSNTPGNLHDVRAFQKAVERARSKQHVPEAVDEFIAFWGPVRDLIDQAKPLIKKGRKPSDDPTKTPPRTLEHTGTCPVCEKNVKLDDAGRIVAHGYTVEYHEFVGGCFGVGHLPIEVSPEGLQAYEGILKKAQAARSESLDGWESGKFDTVYDRKLKADVQKDDPRFEGLVEGVKNRLRHEIRMIASDLENVELRLKTWKERTLPGILAGFSR